MELKHTKGPWGLERDGVSLTMGGQVVARNIAPDGAGKEEIEANMRVIACASAAIEMLGIAVDVLRKVTPSGDGDSDEVLSSTIEASMAVIRRAAGQPVLTDGLQPFTVLLLRPDYAANQYGTDTYMTTVRARSVAEAQELAQLEAAEADNGPDHNPEDRNDPDDYAVLLALAGEHSDISVPGGAA